MNFSRADRSMLAKVLGMLGSAHDGEVVNAARKAHEFLQAKGATWPIVLGLDADQPTTTPEPEHLAVARDLLTRGKGIITAWEKQFLIGVMAFKILKMKQLDSLEAIRAKVDAAASDT